MAATDQSRVLHRATAAGTHGTVLELGDRRLGRFHDQLILASQRRGRERDERRHPPDGPLCLTGVLAVQGSLRCKDGEVKYEVVAEAYRDLEQAIRSFDVD